MRANRIDQFHAGLRRASRATPTPRSTPRSAAATSMSWSRPTIGPSGRYPTRCVPRSLRLSVKPVTPSTERRWAHAEGQGTVRSTHGPRSRSSAGPSARNGRTTRPGLCGHGVVRAAAVPHRGRTTRVVAARRGDRRCALRHRNNEPARRSFRSARDPLHGLRAGHLSPGSGAGDLRLAGGRRLRRRLLPPRPDRGLARQHPRAGARRGITRNRARHPRRRSLDHLAGRDRGGRRARVRQRRHRALRRARRHRRRDRGQPGQPRHADAAADRIGCGAGQPFRPGRVCAATGRRRTPSSGCKNRR